MRKPLCSVWWIVLAIGPILFTSCHTPRPLTFARRQGDEIVIAGQLFHTGARVVTWMDPGGYDAYRVERRFSKYTESSWEASQTASKDLSTPNRYGVRGERLLSAEQLERVRGGGWEIGRASCRERV